MKQSFLYIITLFLITKIYSQGTYLPIGGKEEWLINRLEIKTQDNYLTFGVKPYNRKFLVNAVESIDSIYAKNVNTKKEVLTETDQYNMLRFFTANSNWSKPREIYKAEKPLWNTFYFNRANMVDIKDKDYTIIANPIFNFQQGTKGDNVDNFFVNQRGIDVRGNIGGKIGFYMFVTENQERNLLFINQWRQQYNGLPGAGYLKSFKQNGFDYFDSRGGATWKVAKFMDMQLAYDRNFIGNGYRSLFLSDFSTNYMFLKIHTHFGKFNYQNIFAELTSYKTTGNSIYPRKYMRASYLNYQPFKWLNVGLFESLILGKTDKLSLPLFNPVMFTNVSDNNKDKSYGGFDIKVNIAKKVQVYSQVMIDNITFSELKNNWWNNRYGYQAGLKYIDVVGIKNLDVQLETNIVRPFMYASNDTTGRYLHYNTPLAHPLGGNFKEFIGIIRYQPIPKLYLETKAIYYQQGRDSIRNNVNVNFGNSLVRSTNSRPFDYGWTITTGNNSSCTIISVLASYEVKENLFVDVNLLSRNFKPQSGKSSSPYVISMGIRWNVGRRELLF